MQTYFDDIAAALYVLTFGVATLSAAIALIAAAV